MNAVVRVSYKLPEDFPDVIGDLIQKLVVCVFLELNFFDQWVFYMQRLEPSERLGSEETGGIEKLKAHEFFSEHSYDTKWGELLNQQSPLEMKAKLNSRPIVNDVEIEIKTKDD